MRLVQTFWPVTLLLSVLLLGCPDPTDDDDSLPADDDDSLPADDDDSAPSDDDDSASSDDDDSAPSDDDDSASPPPCETAADLDGVTRVLWYHTAFDNPAGPDLGDVNESSFLDMISDIEAGTGWEIDVWYLGTADLSGPAPTLASFNPLSVPLEEYDALFIESDEMALYSWPYWSIAMTESEEPWTPVLDAGSQIVEVRGTRTVITGSDVDFHAGEWRSPDPATSPVDLVSHRDGARQADGHEGLLVNMLQWVIDGDGLGLVAPTLGGSWFESAQLGLALNPASFLLPEIGPWWTDDNSPYGEVLFVDPGHPVHSGLIEADLQGWPNHGTILSSIPEYVGIAETTLGTGTPAGFVTVVKDHCGR